jgi:hypothetical protein
MILIMLVNDGITYRTLHGAYMRVTDAKVKIRWVGIDTRIMKHDDTARR